MGIKTVIPVILGVLTDFRVIGTAVAMLVVMEFAKFITNYRKKPPKPKKAKPAPTPAPQAEGEAAAEESSE